MAFSRPPIYEEHLLMGVVHELGNNRAAGVNYIIERPAEDGLPEVIRIVDIDEGYNLPIYVSSGEEEEGEEEEGEVEIGIVDAGEGDGVPPLSSDDEDEFEEDGHQLIETDEEEDEETDDDEDLSDWASEDSGYDSMYEDEEDFEDDDDVRPRSPLIQQFPGDNFFQGWRQAYPPIGVPAAGPVAEPLDVFVQQLVVELPLVPVQNQELPGQQVEPPEEGLPLGSLRSEECAPSTSGLGSSTKRSREESHTEQVSVKRQRWNCEESHKESAPSTSGLSAFTNRSREEGYRDSAPSTSGLGSSTKRSREESPTEQVSVKRQRWNCEESHEESAPSTSGLGSSTKRSREEGYRDSAPFTSDLNSSTNRRYWPGPFEYQMWADDSDSD